MSTLIWELGTLDPYIPFLSALTSIVFLLFKQLHRRLRPLSDPWNSHGYSSSTHDLPLLLRARLGEFRSHAVLIRTRRLTFFFSLQQGIFTFAQACAQTSQQMYAFRFCVGMFESAFFPSLLCEFSSIKS